MTRQKNHLRDPEEEYINAAILHLELLNAGNRQGSNAAHDRLIRAIGELRKRDDRGRSFLLRNLSGSDENVRLWSAAHLLPLEEKIALAELKNLECFAKSWVVSLNADTTAAEWRKGTLDID